VPETTDHLGFLHRKLDAIALRIKAAQQQNSAADECSTTFNSNTNPRIHSSKMLPKPLQFLQLKMLLEGVMLADDAMTVNERRKDPKKMWPR
jgi:hypothetical protein